MAAFGGASGFGTTPAGGGLFGAKPATGGFGGFGSTPAASTAPTNPFGTTQPTASTGFGGFGTTPAQPTQTGFGGFGTTTQQPAAGGLGGFGTNTAGQTGGLSFGAKPATGGFGAPATGGFGAPAAGGGLFGGSTPAQTGTGLGGGFGAGSTGFATLGQKPATGTGFGGFGGGFGTAQQPAAGGFQLNQQVQQPQQAQPPAITFDTLFKAAEIQQYRQPILDLERNIMNETQSLRTVESQLKEQKPKIEKLKTDIDTFSQKVAAVQHDVSSDEAGVAQVGELTAKDIASVEFYDWARQPFVKASFEGYFIELVKSFQDRINTYNSRIKELEEDIECIDSRGSFSGQELLKLMENQAMSFLTLATKVAELHAQMDTIRQGYHELCIRRQKRDAVQEKAKERDEQRRRAALPAQPVQMAAPDYSIMATRGYSGVMGGLATAQPQQQQPTATPFGQQPAGFGFNTAPGTAFGFGAPAPTATTAAGGLKFGSITTTTTTAPQPSLTLGAGTGLGSTSLPAFGSTSTAPTLTSLPATTAALAAVPAAAPTFGFNPAPAATSTPAAPPAGGGPGTNWAAHDGTKDDRDNVKKQR